MIFSGHYTFIYLRYSPCTVLIYIIDDVIICKWLYNPLASAMQTEIPEEGQGSQCALGFHFALQAFCSQGPGSVSQRSWVTRTTMPHSHVPGFGWYYGNSQAWLGHFHYTLGARKQTNLYNAHKQSFLISFNGTLKTRLSIVCCVLNNLLMIIKDAQSLPTISALYLTKKIRIQEESKWNELHPRRRCYLQRNP